MKNKKISKTSRLVLLIMIIAGVAIWVIFTGIDKKILMFH